MNASRISMIVATFVLVVTPAWADWDPGDGHKMHWPQLPDLNSTGLDTLAGPLAMDDVSSVVETFLADDWKCSQTGPVTDIHIWGSYINDKPLIDPSLLPNFSLVIYSNIPDPDGSGTGYSKPGDPLWDMYLRPTAVRRYPDPNANFNEGFYNPFEDLVIGSDTQVWQFNFDIPAREAFQQHEGEIYWLGIHHTYDLNDNGQVDPLDQQRLIEERPLAFGWKTSGSDHFEDDAVWTEIPTFSAADPHFVPPDDTDWQELRYPDGHAFEGQSIDLSFVITIPEPASLTLLALGLLAICLRERRE